MEPGRKSSRVCICWNSLARSASRSGKKSRMGLLSERMYTLRIMPQIRHLRKLSFLCRAPAWRARIDSRRVCDLHEFGRSGPLRLRSLIFVGLDLLGLHRTLDVGIVRAG